MKSLFIGLIIIIVGFAGTIRDPFWGLVVFSMFTHITPQQLSMDYISPLRVPFFLSLFVLLSYLISSKYPAKIAERPVEFWLMVIMLLGMLVGGFNAYDRKVALEYTFTFAKFVLFLLLFINIINSIEKVKWFINALMISAGWMVYKCWDLRGTTGFRFENIHGGIVMDSNMFAAAHVLLFPLLVRQIFLGDWKIRFVAALCAFGMLMSIIITGSRGGFLGMVSELVAFAFIYKSHRKKVISFLIVLVLTASVFVSNDYLGRIGDVFSPGATIEEDASAAGRIAAWKLSYEIWKENIIWGCGIHNFEYYNGYYNEGLPWGARGHVAHSLWFQSLVEGGLMVFIPLVTLLGLFFYRTTKICKNYANTLHKQHIHDIYALQVGMIGFLICATFINRLFYEPIYWWCGLAYIHTKIQMNLLGEEDQDANILSEKNIDISATEIREIER